MELSDLPPPAAKILVVEDEPLIRMDLVASLEDMVSRFSMRPMPTK
jgi:hypothetical protein